MCLETVRADDPRDDGAAAAQVTTTKDKLDTSGKDPSRRPALLPDLNAFLLAPAPVVTKDEFNDRQRDLSPPIFDADFLASPELSRGLGKNGRSDNPPDFLAPVFDADFLSSPDLAVGLGGPSGGGVVPLGEFTIPSHVAQAQAADPQQPLDVTTTPAGSGATASPLQPLDFSSPGLSTSPTLGGSSLDEILADVDRAAQRLSTRTGGSAGAAPAGGNDLDRGVLATSVTATELAAPPALRSTPSVDVVTSGEMQTLGVSDATTALVESAGVQTVGVQRRSPIDFDPHLRGYRIGQIYIQSDWSQWFPARQDLDTILSKLDPSLVQDLIVVPGPYGVRYGPGFSFIDVVGLPTPRYENTEIHSRFGITTRTNGGQLYGRETVFGGSSNWGFIFNYGNRTGADYDAGNGRRIPSSYLAQNFLTQFGYDFSDDSWVEFRYQRLDQTDTEYAAQFFDINALVTDAYTLNYVNESCDSPWTRMRIDAWYNQTKFAGDTENPSKQTFNVINRVEAAIGGLDLDGFTSGGTDLTGFRSAMTFGEDGNRQLTVGADYRRQRQGIREQFAVFDPPSETPIEEFETNLPRSTAESPGVFAELTLPWSDRWTTTFGTRVDWVHTEARVGDIRDNSSLPGGPDELSQSDVLYAFYMTSDAQLADRWKARFGFGQAQRAPTLVDRYADGVFLGIIQSGFSRVIGDPTLDEERAWQIDLSLNGEIGNTRMRFGGFHSWILDYITFIGNEIDDPSGARLLRSYNTDLATLTGFECYFERSFGRQFITFGSLQYVDGRDREIDRPLAAIYPLEGTVGVRLVDPDQGRKWGLEYGARIVNDQDRLGALRIGTANVVDIIELEERTPGFAVLHVRGYWNATDSLNFVAGVDNLNDRNYLEHLNLRLPDDGNFTGTRVLAPGITPYFTMEWTY